MHIYLEGADCTGKSTFAYSLTSAFEYHYLHRGPLPHDWDQNDYLHWIAREPTVFDRLLLSETVYAERQRKPLSMSNAQHLRMIRLMGATGIQVVLTAEPETLRTRYNPNREIYSIDEIIDDNAQFFCTSMRDEWRPLPTIYLASEFVRDHTEEAVQLIGDTMADLLKRSTNGRANTAQCKNENCGKTCNRSCGA